MGFKKTFPVVFLFLFFVSDFLWAESVWVRYGWQAFRNVSDASMLALGGSQPLENSNLAQLGNPALTNRQVLNRFTYSHQSRFAGLVNGDLAAVTITAFGNRSLGLVLLNESVGQIPDTRDLLLDWGEDSLPATGDVGEGNGVLDDGERLDGSELDYFKQRQLGLHIGTAWEMGQFNTGVGVKILYHALGGFQGYGIGFDIGVITDLWQGASASLVLTDATTSWLVWDSGTVERSAPTLQTGISQTYKMALVPIEWKIIASTNLGEFMVEDGSDIQLGDLSLAFGGGIQMCYKERTLIRFGRNYLGQIGAGLGFSWPNVGLDYAFQPSNTSSDLGISHYLTFSFNPTWLGLLVKGI